MSGSDARALSRSLLDLCRMRKLTVATAESCTGGLVAGALTDIPGSSDVIDRGFVTYSNDAKRAMLGVKTATLENFGAVSKETATAMAIGAVRAVRRRGSRWASCISRSLPATAEFCIANAASARSAAAPCGCAPSWKRCAC
jgi:nicotinamide mononucleotide (NMN) deamidase PncC